MRFSTLHSVFLASGPILLLLLPMFTSALPSPDVHWRPSVQATVHGQLPFQLHKRGNQASDVSPAPSTEGTSQQLSRYGFQANSKPAFSDPNSVHTSESQHDLKPLRLEKRLPPSLFIQMKKKIQASNRKKQEQKMHNYRAEQFFNARNFYGG